MYTQVKWNISLNDTRGAEHELEIEIFDYDPSAPFAQFIALPFEITKLNIPNFRSEANNTRISWTDNKSIQISEIARVYPYPSPNPLIVHCKFDIEEFTSTYGDFTILTIYYMVKDMKASSLDIIIRLPNIWIVRFYVDKFLLKILSWLHLNTLLGKENVGNIVGSYKITEALGSQVQRWEVLESGPSPILKFIIPEGASMTSIDFSYVRALNPFWYLISLFISYKILHWLFSIIW